MNLLCLVAAVMGFLEDAFTALGDAMVITSAAEVESATVMTSRALDIASCLVSETGAAVLATLAIAFCAALGGPVAAGVCITATAAIGAGGLVVISVTTLTVALEALFASLAYGLIGLVLLPLLIPLLLLSSLSLDDAVWFSLDLFEFGSASPAEVCAAMGGALIRIVALALGFVALAECEPRVREATRAGARAAGAVRTWVVVKQAANRKYWEAARARALRRRRVAMVVAVSAPGGDGRPALAGGAHARARQCIAEMMR